MSLRADLLALVARAGDLEAELARRDEALQLLALAAGLPGDASPENILLTVRGRLLDDMLPTVSARLVVEGGATVLRRVVQEEIASVLVSLAISREAVCVLCGRTIAVGEVCWRASASTTERPAIGARDRVCAGCVNALRTGAPG